MAGGACEVRCRHGGGRVRDKLRAGLVGLGSMGRNHARVLQSMPDVELVGAVDPEGDAHGAMRLQEPLRELGELLARFPDFCVVAVPTSFHEPVCIALAEAGVPTLVEKPLAGDIASARRIVDAFESRGVLGCVGQTERYNPALQALRRRLDAGELGEIYQVATRRQGPFPARIADIGVVMDLATHDIDLTRWVTGQDFYSVAAHTAHKSGRRHEDLVTVLGLLDEGATTSHLVNWLSPLKERITVVTGDRGCFIADTLSADLTFVANASVAMEWDALTVFRGVAEGDMVRYAIPKPEPLRVELEAFCAAVAKGTGDVVALRDGLRTVSVAEAILRSAENGHTVLLGGSH